MVIKGCVSWVCFLRDFFLELPRTREREVFCAMLSEHVMSDQSLGISRRPDGLDRHWHFVWSACARDDGVSDLAGPGVRRKHQKRREIKGGEIGKAQAGLGLGSVMPGPCVCANSQGHLLACHRLSGLWPARTQARTTSHLQQQGDPDPIASHPTLVQRRA